MKQNFAKPFVYTTLVLLLAAETSPAASWFVQKASSQWQATNTNVTISYGTLRATGTTKAHLSIDLMHNTDYLFEYPTVRTVSVRVGEDQVLASDCTIRRHNSDGSGSLHGFSTLTQQTGYDELTRTSSVTAYNDQFLQIECNLQANDTIHGVSYKTDLDP